MVLKKYYHCYKKCAMIGVVFGLEIWDLGLVIFLSYFICSRELKND